MAAEDVAVCVRMRRRVWKVLRIDADMTRHDAAMTRLGQWRKRAERCGYAYALGARLHGCGPERHFVSQVRRVVLWGFFLPVLALGLAPLTYGLSLALLLLYPLQVWRVYRRARRGPLPVGDAAAWALSCVAA